jgi:tetratricopeptide (TPR) repeat protein
MLLLIAAWSTEAAGRERGAEPARISVEAGAAGCTVQVDGVAAGSTDTQGHLVVDNVDPGDHYLHVRCPGEAQENGYFVSPAVGATASIHHAPDARSRSGADRRGEPDAEDSLAETKIKLRELTKEAATLRNAGRFDEAVQQLRQAASLDPENSDLHRELGITFLLDHDWKRARVEMIEAVHHDPNDADAHNGLGYALEKLGDTRAALNEYRTATHLEPDDPSYRRHYIETLANLSEEEPAKKKGKAGTPR